MKQLIVIAGLGLALTGCMTDYGWSEAPLDDRFYAAPVPVDWWGRDVASVDIFYSSLARYGSWGNHARYGRVFLPAGVGPGWQPYSRGYWRNDPRFGRMFVSSDPWGWATYHYGRWGRDARFGWFWVPDTRFGPSWVDWRSGGGWSSWSPLPPPGWVNWGYGWGNDWWLHAPGAWAYRPGLDSHLRRGRHDWDGRRDHRHDRDWDHGRDRDRDWVDRTRPGESPMAGFVRNRLPPPEPMTPAYPMPPAPPGADLSQRRDPGDMWVAPRRETRARPADGNGFGGFVRNRVQPGGAPQAGGARTDAAVAPRAMPAEPRMAAPPRMDPPQQRFDRAERVRPAYDRAPADRPVRAMERSPQPRERDLSQQVSDD